MMNETKNINAEHTEKLTERPPVVAVLGHIDHGKTTLLDYIRKTNVAGKEAGGITQHIGAYEIAHLTADGQEKKITFIDTPGHEAFSKMRSRGAQVADIAILVVAADEGAKPQTLEALEQILASKAVLVVAINKIDRPEAKPERVKQQLAEKGVLLEGWGGTVSNQEISAKTGQGVPELLDLILLAAEMEELKADSSAPAEGIVIESHKDAKIGNSATLVIKNGAMRVGNYITYNGTVDKIKSIRKSDGQPVPEATFSSPVLITGFSELPLVGEVFRAAPDLKTAEKLKKAVKLTPSAPARKESAPTKKKELAVVLKADTFGSKEALEKLIDELSFETVAAKVVKSDVGEVNESDVSVAEATKAVVAAFKVKILPSMAKMLEKSGARLIQADIIYDLINAIKAELSNLLEPEIIRIDIGRVSVLATFKMDRSKMIVGGKVASGKIKKGAKIEVKRDGVPVLSGKVTQIKYIREEIDEATIGKECGMMVIPVEPTDKKITAGDILEVYEEEIKRPTLD